MKTTYRDSIGKRDLDDNQPNIIKEIRIAGFAQEEANNWN